MMMATQMTAPGAPPDMKKAYKEEWEALEVTSLQLDIMKQKQDLSVQNLWNYQLFCHLIFKCYVGW